MYENFLKLGENERERKLELERKNRHFKSSIVEKQTANVKSQKETEILKVTSVFLPSTYCTSNLKSMLNADLSLVSASFNPRCTFCHSELCTKAFNPKFTICGPLAD